MKTLTWKTIYNTSTHILGSANQDYDALSIGKCDNCMFIIFKDHKTVTGSFVYFVIAIWIQLEILSITFVGTLLVLPLKCDSRAEVVEIILNNMTIILFIEVMYQHRVRLTRQLNNMPVVGSNLIWSTPVTRTDLMRPRRSTGQ